MKRTATVLVVLFACSGRNAAQTEPDGIGATQPTADAGAVAAVPQAADAGPVAADPVPVTGSPSKTPVSCDQLSLPAGYSDGTPPDAGVMTSPGPTPDLLQQAGSWVPTGAAGCEGLVPAAVTPQLSWTAPNSSGDLCFLGEPFLDGDGHLTYDGAFFASDGSASQLSNIGIVGRRPSGFFFSTYPIEETQWDFAAGPDGSNQGFVHSDSDPACRDFIYASYNLTPNPRGGYVESRIIAVLTDGGELWSAEVRFVDSALMPRTQWLVGAQWTYGDNIDSNVYVDPTGKALVMMFFDPPMSMPCAGTMTAAFWAADDGTVTAFTPVTPTLKSGACDADQFAGFGTGVVLAEGGVAFYHPPGTSTNGSNESSETGWYVRYPSGSGVGASAPAWLSDYDGSLNLLFGGSAYVGTRRDAVSCTRTAEIVGPAGQLCATLPLEGSGGCDASDETSPDGTLVLHASDSCSLRWWPKLGRGH
jgi:hypothetical protein